MERATLTQCFPFAPLQGLWSQRFRGKKSWNQYFFFAIEFCRLRRSCHQNERMRLSVESSPDEEFQNL
jgi:hypothetical protein